MAVLPMAIRIRRANPEDAGALASVEVMSWRAAYRGLMPDGFLDGLSYEDKTVGWRQNLLKHGPFGRKRVLVAVGDAGVIGFVRVGFVEDEGAIGLVYLLYVLPEYWGRGVGRALMDAAMDELRDLGWHKAVLWVLRDNQRARAFYEGLGWCQDGRTTTEECDFLSPLKRGASGDRAEPWCRSVSRSGTHAAGALYADPQSEGTRSGCAWKCLIRFTC